MATTEYKHADDFSRKWLGLVIVTTILRRRDPTTDLSRAENSRHHFALRCMCARTWRRERRSSWLTSLRLNRQQLKWMRRSHGAVWGWEVRRKPKPIATPWKVQKYFSCTKINCFLGPPSESSQILPDFFQIPAIWDVDWSSCTRRLTV